MPDLNDVKSARAGLRGWVAAHPLGACAIALVAIALVLILR